MKKLFAFLLLIGISALSFAPSYAAPQKGRRPAASKAAPAKKPEPPPPPPKVNFDTKKAEIFEVLNLNEKQQIEADKNYNKARAEIVKINKEMNEKIAERKELKRVAADSEANFKKLTKMNKEIQELYQIRDKVHNKALKKFEKSLNDTQKELWPQLKREGARMFPELDEVE